MQRSVVVLAIIIIVVVVVVVVVVVISFFVLEIVKNAGNECSFYKLLFRVK